MKAQKYILQLQQLKSNLEELKQDIYNLENEYINNTSKYKIGDKVIVIAENGKEYVGFVSGIYVDRRLLIKYKFVKEKKDGTASKHELWHYNLKIVGLAN